MTWASSWVGEVQESALPYHWEELWGDPSPFLRRQLRELKRGFEDLASQVKLSEPAGELASLVHPQDNGAVPVHRWYQYKEAYSHRLPREVIARIGAGESRVVADVFGGVATTALALQRDPRIDRVISVEYSPLAHLVGATKLAWHRLSPKRLRRLASLAVRFRQNRRIAVPDLAAFHNAEIFHPAVAADLIAARRHLESMDLSSLERRFFLVGLAAIVEDCSGAMKDGRALRIVRGRARRASSLAEVVRRSEGLVDVRTALATQLDAMIYDLEVLSPSRSAIDPEKAIHIRGDARHLEEVRYRGGYLFADESVSVHCYSPPYLNCIDYTEVYKLELWALGLVRDQVQFRELRLGTLRSHPSVEFPHRPYLEPLAKDPVTEQIEAVASFIERNGARPGIGRMVANYFADMAQVLNEQYRTLEPEGRVVCIVGNSTFSRRDITRGGREERWRIPVLTDVLLTGLAKAVGFAEAEIWSARELRARNVENGAARESFVVLTKVAV